MFMIERFLAITVDPQNTFCPGGELPVAEGDQVMDPANRVNAAVKKMGGLVIFSRDWHPEKMGDHFTKFPPHGIAGTKGAEFHPDLDATLADYIVSKGIHADMDGFSLFEGIVESSDLTPEKLIVNKIATTGFFVTGLALDYCVLATVLDLCKLGKPVYVVIDGTRAVNINPGDGIRAIAAMINAGARIITVDKAIEMIEAA